jgi:excisionase family DNA binding protein
VSGSEDGSNLVLLPVPEPLAAMEQHRRVNSLPGQPFLTRDDVMTAAEVADLLHLPLSTVYQLARQGKLPASRLGRTWRFLRPRLEQMLRA